LEFSDKFIVIDNDDQCNLENSTEIFIYGTYEKCPSVDKFGVLEIAMLALQRQISKVTELTEKVKKLSEQVIELKNKC